MRLENFAHHCQVLCSHQNHLTGTTLDGKRTCFNTTKSYRSFRFYSYVLKYAVAERKNRFISYPISFSDTEMVNNEAEPHNSTLYGLPCFGRDQLLLSATPRNCFQVYWFTYRLTGRSCQKHAAESLQTDRIQLNRRGKDWLVDWVWQQNISSPLSAYRAHWLLTNSVGCTLLQFHRRIAILWCL
jgi:hypothetical protein